MKICFIMVNTYSQHDMRWVTVYFIPLPLTYIYIMYHIYIYITCGYCGRIWVHITATYHFKISLFIYSFLKIISNHLKLFGFKSNRFVWNMSISEDTICIIQTLNLKVSKMSDIGYCSEYGCCWWKCSHWFLIISSIVCRKWHWEENGVNIVDGLSYAQKSMIEHSRAMLILNSADKYI